MAAANDLVDRAVRTKQVQERKRAGAAGAFGHENKTARRARDREAGRLDEWERLELLYLWSGNDSAIIQSTQGAIVDRLLRAPPRIGEELDREVVGFLLDRGPKGAPRERLVELLVAENVGATRHEARLTLLRMVGAGRVEFFVESVARRRSCACKSTMGEHQGTSAGAPGTRRFSEPCSCGAGAEETIPTAMVRIVPGRHAKRVPGRMAPETRWAKADDALRAFCATMACSESTRGAGGRLPAVPRGGAEKARSAMGRLGPGHARVLERVYGSTSTPRWSGLSPEAARLAPLCPEVERARRRYVDDLLTARGHWGDPDASATADRSTHAPDVMKKVLDQQPDDEPGKLRWARARLAFIQQVEREAAKLLEDAVTSYREARGSR